MSQPDVESQLARWADAGLLTASQAERIRDWESSQGPHVAAAAVPPIAASRPSTTRPLLMEALAYVGGVIILVAVGVMLDSYWSGLPTEAKAALAGGGAAALLAAGALVPQRLGMVAARLRGVLWLLSAGCLFGMLVVLTDTVGISARRSALMIAACIAGYAGLLWLRHRTVLQQAGAFVAVEFLAVAVVVQFGEWTALTTGVTQTLVAVGWAVLAWHRLLPGTSSVRLVPAGPSGTDHRRAAAWQRRMGLITATGGAAVGAVVLGAQDHQPWLGVAVAAAMVGTAVAVRDLAVLAMGAVSTLVVLPIVVTHYFDAPLVVALALLIAGGALVVLAVVAARRRGRPAPATNG